jgi:hypothetical protein
MYHNVLVSQCCTSAGGWPLTFISKDSHYKYCCETTSMYWMTICPYFTIITNILVIMILTFLLAVQTLSSKMKVSYCSLLKVHNSIFVNQGEEVIEVVNNLIKLFFITWRWKWMLLIDQWLLWNEYLGGIYF